MSKNLLTSNLVQRNRNLLIATLDRSWENILICFDNNFMFKFDNQPFVLQGWFLQLCLRALIIQKWPEELRRYAPSKLALLIFGIWHLISLIFYIWHLTLLIFDIWNLTLLICWHLTLFTFYIWPFWFLTFELIDFDIWH